MFYVSFSKLHSGIDDRSHIWGGWSHGLNSASDLRTVSLFHENGMHWNVHLGGNKHMLLVFSALFGHVIVSNVCWIVDSLWKVQYFFYNLSLSAASAAHISMYQRVKNTLLLTTTKPLYKSNSNFGSSLQYPRVNPIPTLTTVWIRTSYPT